MLPNVRAVTPHALARAGDIIRAGGLVAFPTETVYGLGADATNGQAVARIFEAKGRPKFNPLIVHVSSLEAALALGNFSKTARVLASAFWPGPLTIVTARRTDCAASPLVSAGLDTIAIRMPDHPVAEALLKSAGRPLAAPSANRSGHVSATSAEHVAADFGGSIDLVLDGGKTRAGIESTVVSIVGDEPILLRHGAVPVDDIESAIGRPLIRREDTKGALTSPGQLESHYATRALIRLNARNVVSNEALLAFGPSVPNGAAAVLNLSAAGDLIEASANLFAFLRALDQTGATTIAVMPIPNRGLGEAINDRLRRAAAPRPSV